MDHATVRDLKAELERFGADSTCFIMRDDRAVVLTPEGEQGIRAREVLPDGGERGTSAREAPRSPREWGEGHRLG